MQVYPLFAAMGFAVGICGYQLVRNICINPDVRCVSLSQFFFFFFFFPFFQFDCCDGLWVFCVWKQRFTVLGGSTNIENIDVRPYFWLDLD